MISGHHKVSRRINRVKSKGIWREELLAGAHCVLYNGSAKWIVNLIGDRDFSPLQVDFGYLPWHNNDLGPGVFHSLLVRLILIFIKCLVRIGYVKFDCLQPLLLLCGFQTVVALDGRIARHKFKNE